MLEIGSADEGVRVLTLDRPERYNALSGALLAALASAFAELAGDRATRVVVITGRGRGFCAGHDLKELVALPDEPARRELFRLCADVMLAVRTLPQPVIAAVEGTATAAGCQLVATSDLAVAARDARFATPGVDIGLFCSTPMVPLVRAVPPKVALRMLLTGEPLDAERALAAGLVSDLAEPGEALAAALALARTIAGKDAGIVADGKARFHALRGLPEAEAYAAAVEAMTCELDGPAAREGIAAFLERRAPVWPSATRDGSQGRRSRRGASARNRAS
jgi:enoyl-CoA hydratase/carnithine racemase